MSANELRMRGWVQPDTALIQNREFFIFVKEWLSQNIAVKKVAG